MMKKVKRYKHENCQESRRNPNEDEVEKCKESRCDKKQMKNGGLKSDFMKWGLKHRTFYEMGIL